MKRKYTENELLQMLKRKDENAFSYVYDLYAPSLYGVILREVKNEALASEILKKAFLQAWSECNSLDCIKHRLFRWLFAVTQKTAARNYNVTLGTALLSRAAAVS